MAVLQAQDSILPASPCLMTSTSRARHRRAHAPHLLTTAQLRGCASRLLTELEGACSRPLFAEVALCAEEMRRERLESFGAGGDEEESSGGDEEEGQDARLQESDSAWAEVSSVE